MYHIAMQGKESSPIRAGGELIPVLAAGNGRE
jgi:hypothetical protein